MQKKLFPYALHFHCTKHIIDNCRKASTVKYHDGLIWGIQGSKTEDKYNKNLANLRLKCPSAADYLAHIPAESWCLWPHIKTRSLHGSRTNNIAESANAMNMPIRRMEPWYAMDQLTQNQLRSYSERLVAARIRKSKGELLTEYAQSEYSIQASLARDCLVEVATIVPLMSNRVSPQERHYVDLDSLQCTCGYPMQYQLPCKHMIAFASIRGDLKDYPTWVQRSCSRWVLKNYLKSLEEIRLYPVCWDDMVADGVTTAPPLMKSKGRPRKHKRQEFRLLKEKKGAHVVTRHIE
ncbi:Zinc finger SWIM-type [Perkinsela sp. CCAP 1560/4]|nr:Zinc finger SWIM-type [Perkinsela sp. CCAP 1560/4]KNH07998.1 Zinc finger SWIM-type [Perkinsela sp. CCAP 1560/4]|eukprot:KNH07961.1 Zinc finger SWIM-type [Perkinsela sp. CCAP 1560/4]